MLADPVQTFFLTGKTRMTVIVDISPKPCSRTIIAIIISPMIVTATVVEQRNNEKCNDDIGITFHDETAK